MLSSEYLAGLVDGEGYIELTKRVYSGHVSFATCFGISICNEELLKEVKETLGVGTIHRQVRPPRQDLFIYRCQNKEGVLSILTRLLPHLRIKRRIAELLCEFCSRPFRSHYTERDYQIYSEISTLQLKKGKGH
jgi:hypothetical protein